VLLSFLLISALHSQTNVQGTINSNTTWTSSSNPYVVTGSLTIRDGATLTIQNGVEVRFTTSSYITVGYSSSSKGNLSASGVTFKGMLTSDARIYFKNNSASGSLSNCTFDNTYLWIENCEITVSGSSFDNCVYPIVLEDGGKLIHIGNTFGSNNQNYGIQVKGTIIADYTLRNISIPFYVENVTLRDGATLTIENGVEIFFPTSTGITVGYSSIAKGVLNANEVVFKGTTSSDSKIYFKSASGNGTLDNCTFDNAYILIENTEATIHNSKFYKCNYPIVLEDAATVDILNLQYNSNVLYPGLCLQGTIKANYALNSNHSPYFINGLTVRDNATLTIETGSEIYFTSTSGLTVGYNSTSKGNLVADGISFKGLTSSDDVINIKFGSTAQIINSGFDNIYINVDNSSPQIRNSRFKNNSYSITTRNGATPTIINNDFFKNNYALKNYGTNSVIAENNFWGDPSGPIHIDNPNAKGEKIDGLVDFEPYSQIPYNGVIDIGIVNPSIDFGEHVIGSSTETTYKLVTSKSTIDLFVSKVETNNTAFTVTTTNNYWLSKSDTLSLKIKFTPQNQTTYSGNLLIYNNKLNSSPIAISLSGKGTSPLVAQPSQLNFDKVDMKSSKTIRLSIKNQSIKTVTIDSVKSTNAKFTYILDSGTYSMIDYDESKNQFQSSINLEIENTAAAFTLSPGKTKDILVTFKPTSRTIENGVLEIYHSSNKKDNISLQAEGFASPLAINITSLNIQNFPYLFLNALVDTFNTSIQTLTASNFQVYENGVRELDNFSLIPPGQSGGARLTDIVFIMDNSGSMGDEQTSVSNNVIDFVNKLSTSGVDYALGLCRYGSTSNSGNPIIEDNGVLTSDPNYFKNSVWTKNSANGGKEPGYYAIKQSASSFSFRPGSQKIFIVITDENPNQGGATIDEALAVCTESKITFFVLTNSNLYSLFSPITSATNGEIYDIHSNFNNIFDFISTNIISSYLIQYKSSEPIANNFNRQVVVKVDYMTNTSSDTVYYNPGSIPKIQRTSSTLAFHNQAWIEGTAFKIDALITDDIEPFVQSAILYYRTTGQTFFTSLQMQKETGSIYTATIPLASVHAPGVDYYITASDGNVSVSDPKLTPSQTPYQIAILPNVAPNIQHNIVESATRNTNVNISADVTDNTNNVAEAKLFYRTVGQLIYANAAMTKTTGNTYQGQIPAANVFGDGVEYYIKASDDFGLSSYHGKAGEPHLITAVALSVVSVLDTLTSAPSIKKVQVPSNGTGYCYFSLYANGIPVRSNEDVKAILTSSNVPYNVLGRFIRPGVFRLDFPNSLMINNQMNFKLGNGITVSDTFYTFNSSAFTINAEKINSPFNRTWTIFASGSAGVSGMAGAIGAGVSASAAKLSIKGSAGAGIEIKLDQDNNRFLGRRLEASLTAEVEIPQVNAAVASATVGSTSATMKTFFGQQFSFTGLGYSSDNVKMAEAGFLLETMSYAGMALSPGAGAVLAALITTLNAASGVYSMYDNGFVNFYTGLGLEGSIGLGLKAEFQAVEVTALNPSINTSLNLTFNGFNPSHPSITDNTLTSVKLSQAFNFNFSTLDFGLSGSDDVSLTGGNFSLFDAGLGSEVSVEAKLNSSLGFNGLSVNLKGGGGINLFGANSNKWYSTTFNFSKDYLTPLTNAGTSLIGLFTKTKSLPIGTDILGQSVQTIKSAYGQVLNKPIDVTTEEIEAKGYDFSLGLELDVAVVLGLGVTFGINGKYYDEVSYPRKYSKIYLNGNNYLIYSNEYSDVMKSASFTNTIQDIFSGVLPLIASALTNILKSVEQLIVAGATFILNAASATGDAIGAVVGKLTSGGNVVITTFTSHLPSFPAVEPFTEPKVKRICYSKNVMHGSSSYGFTSYESNLVIFSRIMNVAFTKSGETIKQDTLTSPVAIKMLIYPLELQTAGFSIADSSKIAMYVYDKTLLNWIHIGGVIKGDTVIVQTNRLGAFGLGIELNQITDNEAPTIEEYGPQQGSIWSTFPEVYVIVKDNKYGSGIDLTRSTMSINGRQVVLSYDPSRSKIFIQTTKNEIDKIATNRVEVIVFDFAGNKSTVNFDFRANITGVENENTNIYRYNLYQNYPNPFNPNTQIKFSTAKHGDVEISIYDIKGSLIRKIFKGELEAGNHTVEWDGTNSIGYKVSSGVYFCKMKTSDYQFVKKMQLIK